MFYERGEIQDFRKLMWSCLWYIAAAAAPAAAASAEKHAQRIFETIGQVPDQQRDKKKKLTHNNIKHKKTSE